MTEQGNRKTNYKLSLSDSNWKKYPDACEFLSDESHGKAQVVLRLLQMFLQKFKRVNGYCDAQDINIDISAYKHFLATINFNDDANSVKDFIYMAYKAFGDLVGANIEDRSFVVYLITTTFKAQAFKDCWNNYLKLGNKGVMAENVISDEDNKDVVVVRNNETKNVEEQPIISDDDSEDGFDDEDNYSLPSYAKVVEFDDY